MCIRSRPSTRTISPNWPRPSTRTSNRPETWPASSSTHRISRAGTASGRWSCRRFVRDHEKHIKKVAVVTDSHLADVAEHLGSHFVSAQIRHFPAGEVEQARQWIAGN
ncbi:STAS/SEC14 domain-containing protein [Mycolicibacterium litorale]|uniref:STAS/SEC14 domain-containing protein n=1 Tax=Candidatus Mycolicibacterium alkanivorans TaxID=2954114 RepID=A0ABS9YQB7_9MYCO|nr:STAS/SEC14 domain-containing protein [Candidatus Mycolicibacterium alkanivorans]